MKTDNDNRRRELEARREATQDSSRPYATEFQHTRGKLTARERISSLCDKQTFQEFGGLALPSDSDPEKPAFADALITGSASVEGRPVFVASADFTVSGGSNGDLGFEKLRTTYERATDSGVPMIQLREGVGHRISEGLDSRQFAPGFNVLGAQAEMAGWVPTPTAVLGQGFAAMTVLASMSDFVVLVKGKSFLGIAPPPLVKAAIGEDIDAETLGGAELQASQNGIADLVVDGEEEALGAIRTYLSYFPVNAGEVPPEIPTQPPAREFSEKLAEVIPSDMRMPYDVRDVIKGIVDGNSLFEIKPGYAKNIVCGLTRIGGRSVGVIANQPKKLAGALDSPACEKASHFVNVCDAFGIPLLFLLDLPGFLVGSKVESSKLGRRSVRLIYEIARTTVPIYNVVLRKAYGGAYMAMNGGRTFRADLTLAWPTAEFAAMNVETAIEVAYKREIAVADDAAAVRLQLAESIRDKLGPIRAAEGFGIDDVILPEETRNRLMHAIAVAPARKYLRKTTPKVRGIAPI